MRTNKKSKFLVTSLAAIILAQGFSSNIAQANTADNIEETSKQFLGLPYVWGGTSPISGFDCSGFVQYIFKQYGYSLPRTAAEQFRVGTSVEIKDLQKGDLVYFQTYKPGASHVGIYLSNGNFINSNGSGLSITNLSNSYYSARYLGARRVLAATDQSKELVSFDTSNSLIQKTANPQNLDETVTGPKADTTNATSDTVTASPTTADISNDTVTDSELTIIEVAQQEKEPIIRKLNKGLKTYTVQDHEDDTLAKVAKHFKVTSADLVRWNKLKSKKIKEGQKLIVKKPKQAISLYSPTMEDVSKQVTIDRTSKVGEVSVKSDNKILEKIVKNALAKTKTTEEFLDAVETAYLPEKTLKQNEEVERLFDYAELTRAELATAIYYLEKQSPLFDKKKIITLKEDVSKDVDDDYWAKEMIDWAVTEGLMKVDKKGKFKPDEAVTFKGATKVMERVQVNYKIDKSELKVLNKNLKKDKEYAQNYFEQLVYNVTIELSEKTSTLTSNSNEAVADSDKAKATQLLLKELDEKNLSAAVTLSSDRLSKMISAYSDTVKKISETLE